MHVSVIKHICRVYMTKRFAKDSASHSKKKYFTTLEKLCQAFPEISVHHHVDTLLVFEDFKELDNAPKPIDGSKVIKTESRPISPTQHQYIFMSACFGWQSIRLYGHKAGGSLHPSGKSFATSFPASA